MKAESDASRRLFQKRPTQGEDTDGSELLKKGEAVRTLLDASEDAAFLLDRKAAFLALNKAASEQFNARVEDLLGQSIFDHLPADQISERKRILEQMLSGRQPARHEYERQGRFFDTRWYPILSELGHVVAIAGFSRTLPTL